MVRNVNWPSIEVGDPLGDALKGFQEGRDYGRGIKFEQEAPQQFADAAAPLSEYGLSTPPDQLKAMFANPNTRQMAIDQVREATARRADANDPMKQLQLKKMQLDVAAAERGPAPPRNTIMDNANTRYRLGREQGLTGEELKRFTLTGELPSAPGGGNAPSGYRFTSEGDLSFIPGGPADPSVKGDKPPTDADVRSAKLSGVVQGDKELLFGKGDTPGIYGALADAGSQMLNTDVNGVRPGYAFTSPDFQSATNALTNIAQSYLYAVSGQAAPAGEVAKIVESVTPKLGESEASVNNKKARLAAYIGAIEASRYDVPNAGAGANDPLGIR